MQKSILWVVVIIVIFLGVYWITGNQEDEINVNNSEKVTNTSFPSTITTPSMNEVIKEDIVAGAGAQAKTGDTIMVHYRGTFTDGKKFDSSYDRSEPFVFTLGAGKVIKGWDTGVIGMQVGGKRKLIIPSEFAYGEQGNPPVIPPSATLVFEIELLGINQ